MKKRDRKTFVLDTNVLIHRPEAILSFRDNDVVIPLWVLEELDKLKSDHEERGRSARKAIRFLNEASDHGDLRKGVKLQDGIILKVVLKHDNTLDSDLDKFKMDNKIILTAYALQQKGETVFFVSKDINARIKASAIGLRAVDYENNKVSVSSQYQGFGQISLTKEQAADFNTNREMNSPISLLENQYVIMMIEGEKTKLLGRFKENKIRLIDSSIEPVCGVQPLNIHQRIAFDMLLDDDLPLVSLLGKAGTGKTLLAVAAGLKKVLEEGKYTKVLVSRPIIPLGKDIGYLPGAKNEKMSHWMQPIFDNLEYIIGVYKKQNAKSIEQLVNNKQLETEAITYIRGRSLPKQFIVIDEAQNLSPHEIKTIVSRAGEGSKVVLTGDPFQIDHPYLDSGSNGLSYLVEAFKGQKIFGHINLARSERSILAELAAELL